MTGGNPGDGLRPEELEIGFAERKDEEQLRCLLAEYGMDIPGPIEEQLVVKAGEEVLAGAKVMQVNGCRFFLEVIGVKKDYMGKGIGQLLLGAILKDPWRCCRRALRDPETGGRFQLATLARGGASSFYRKMGFVPCPMEELPPDYREQCEVCPEREACQPVPMLYAGGEIR